MTTTTTTACPTSNAQGSCGCLTYQCQSSANGDLTYRLTGYQGRVYDCLYPNWFGPCYEEAATVSLAAISPTEVGCSNTYCEFYDTDRAPDLTPKYGTTTQPPAMKKVSWVNTGNMCPDECISGLFGLSKTGVSGCFPRWYPPVTGTVDPVTGKTGPPYHYLYDNPHRGACSNPCGVGGWMVPATQYGERILNGLTPAPCTYVWRNGWILLEYSHTSNGTTVYGTECSSAGGTCIPPAVPDNPPPNGTVGYGGCCKSGFVTTTTTTSTTSSSTTPSPTTTTSTTSASP